MIGFDYTDRIAPVALKAAGCQVVFRYLSNPGWPKNLTLAEAQELHAAGIAIVLNYETSGTFMLGGYGAGQECARSARAQATALGAPATARIYYSADFDVTAAQVSIVMAFLQGAASVDGAAEVDEYGGLRLAQAAAAAGMRPWQTVAWSGGMWEPRDVARQTGEQRYVGGVQVDVNEIEDFGALGAWMPGGVMGTIPASIGQKWPEIAGEFPANGQFDDDSALIWADGGARAAALYAKEARDAVNALAAKVQAPPAVDVKALAAALAPLLTAGATADQVASAVVSHLATSLAKG